MTWDRLTLRPHPGRGAEERSGAWQHSSPFLALCRATLKPYKLRYNRRGEEKPPPYCPRKKNLNPQPAPLSLGLFLSKAGARALRMRHARAGDRMFARALPFLQLHLEAPGGAREARRDCHPHIKTPEGQDAQESCPKSSFVTVQLIYWPFLML